MWGGVRRQERRGVGVGGLRRQERRGGGVGGGGATGQCLCAVPGQARPHAQAGHLGRFRTQPLARLRTRSGHRLAAPQNTLVRGPSGTRPRGSMSALRSTGWRAAECRQAEGSQAARQPDSQKAGKGRQKAGRQAKGREAGRRQAEGRQAKGKRQAASQPASQPASKAVSQAGRQAGRQAECMQTCRPAGRQAGGFLLCAANKLTDSQLRYFHYAQAAGRRIPALCGMWCSQVSAAGRTDEGGFLPSSTEGRNPGGFLHCAALFGMARGGGKRRASYCARIQGGGNTRMRANVCFFKAEEDKRERLHRPSC